MKKALTRRKTRESDESTSLPDRIGEMEGLGRILAECYQQRKEHYERLKKNYPDAYDYLTPEEIQKRVTSPHKLVGDFQDIPVDKIEWPMLHAVLYAGPIDLIEFWDNLLEAANNEFQSGSLTADNIKCRTPFERALLLAIRKSFIDQWQPAGGIDLALIDIMAEAQVCYTRWHHISIMALSTGQK